MNNEILDAEFEEKKSSSLRKKLLIIESILVFSIVFFLQLSLYASSMMSVFLLSILCLIFYYLISPIIRFLKKESNGKISILYFIQNLLLLPFLFGIILKIESWPGANEMLIGGFLGFTLLFIIPHLELEKVKAKRNLHSYVLLINLALFISFLGLLFKVESWQWATEINILGSLMTFILAIFIIISVLSNPKKLSAVGFYIPRLLLALVLTLPSILRLISSI